MKLIIGPVYASSGFKHGRCIINNSHNSRSYLQKDDAWAYLFADQGDEWMVFLMNRKVWDRYRAAARGRQFGGFSFPKRMNVDD